MSVFVRLAGGTLLNLDHVVQLTPENHLQLTSGNTLTLSDADAKTLADHFEPSAWSQPAPVIESAPPADDELLHESDAPDQASKPAESGL